jgi:hypothetical protein
MGVLRRCEGANAIRRVHGETPKHSARAVCRLARPAVDRRLIVATTASLSHRCTWLLTAPRSLTELEQNIKALELQPMSKQERRHWQRFCGLVCGRGRGVFETNWP